MLSKLHFLLENIQMKDFLRNNEFEAKLKSMNLLISNKSLDKLFSVIISKKDQGMVSYIKIKQVCDELKKSVYKSKDIYHAKDLMYGKITTKENHLDHPLINLIEIKLEEKFKTIHDAFRIFDENGDSRLNHI